MILEGSINTKLKESHNPLRSSEVKSFSRSDKEVSKEDLIKLDRGVKRAAQRMADAYPFIPQDSKSSQELYRILHFGKNGVGLLESVGSRPENIFVCVAEDEFACAIGKDIYISTAFLNTFESEDRIAGVMKHEARHIQADHAQSQKADLENELKTLKSIYKSVSLPRMHEMDADVSVPLGLRTAGYDPREYYALLKKSLGSKIGFAHGSKYDRMGIVRLFLKSEEMDLEDLQPSRTPATLSNLPEKTSRFEQVMTYVEKKKLSEAKVVLAEISDEGLLFFLDNILELYREDKPDYSFIEELYFVFLDACITRIDVPGNEVKQAWNVWCFLLKFKDYSLAGIHRIENNFSHKKGRKGIATLLLESFHTDQDIYAFVQHALDFCQSIDDEQKKLFKVYLIDFIDGRGEDLFSGKGFGFFPELVKKEQFKSQFFIEEDALDMPKLVGKNKDSFSYYNGLVEYSDKKKPKIFKPNYEQIIQFYKNIKDIFVSNNLDIKIRIAGVSDKYLESHLGLHLHLSMARLEELDPDRFEHDTQAYLEEHEFSIFSAIVQEELFVHHLERKVREEENRRLGFMYGLNNIRNEIRQRLEGYYRILDRNEIDEKQQFWLNKYIEGMFPDHALMLKMIEERRFDELFDSFDENQFALLEDLLIFSPKLVQDSDRELLVNGVVKWLEKSDPTSEFLQTLFSSQLYRNNLSSTILKNTIAEGDGYSIYDGNDFSIAFKFKDLVLLSELDLIKKLWNLRDESEDVSNRVINILDHIDLTSLSQAGRMLLLSKLSSFIEGRAGFRDQDELENVENPLLQLLRHPVMNQLKDEYIQLLLEQFSDPSTLLSKLIKYKGHLEGNRSKNLISILPDIDEFLLPLQRKILDQIEGIDFSSQDPEVSLEIRSVLKYFFTRGERIRQSSVEDVRILNNMPFMTGLEYIDHLMREGEVNLEAVDMLQEQKLQTPQDLELFEQFWFEKRNVLIKEGYKPVGILAIADQLSEQFMERDNLGLFRAAVHSRTDDTELRKYLSQLWFADFIFNLRDYDIKNKDYQLRTTKNERGEIEFSLEGDTSKFVPFEQFVERFYQNISSNETRFLAVRFLFSEHGLLTNQSGRKELAKFIRQEGLESSEDPRLAKIAKSLINVILEIDTHQEDVQFDPLTVAEPMIPLLSQLILLPPDHPGSNHLAYSLLTQPMDMYMYATLSAKNNRVFSAKTAQQKLKAGQDPYERIKINENDIKQLLTFRASSLNQAQRVEHPATQELRSRIAHIQEIMQGRNPKTFEARTTQRLTPTRSLIAIAETQGTLGNRYLQLHGVVAKVNPEFKSQIRRSYEGVRGQIKSAAMRTVRTEAMKDSAHENLTYFWENLDTFESMDKGGSTVTVYRGTLKDGTQLGVKVQVPNAKHFVAESRGQVLYGLSRMQSMYPFHKFAFQRIEGLVEDIALWANADLSEVDNLEGDKLYRSVHDGLSLNSPFRLSIPQSYETGTAKVKLEEWFNGESLFDFYPNATLEEQNLLTELIVQHNEQQMSTVNPDGVLRVHSNLHPSQYLIATDRENQDYNVALLDRSYYLTFTEEERAFFPLVTWRTASKSDLVDFIDYLIQNARNRDGYPNVKIIKAASKLMNGSTPSFMQNVDIFTELRKSIKIPFKWVLLQQNRLFLDSLINENIF